MRRRRQDGLTRELTDDETVALLAQSPATELVTAALTIQARTHESHPGTFCLAPVVDGRFLPGIRCTPSERAASTAFR